QTFDQFYSARSQEKGQGVGSGVGGGVAEHREVPLPMASVSGAGGDRNKLQMDGPLNGSLSKSEVARRYERFRDQDVRWIKEDESPSARSPMIARTVSLSIVVKEFPTSRSALDSILARYRGYAAQLTVSTNENAPRNLQASLRIPAPALSSAMSDL